MELIKRKWHYLQPPSHYGVTPCSCGNNNTNWSEYENHLWCDNCEKDFIPESNGLFDGPFLISISQLLGYSFTRFNLETKKVEELDKDLLYVDCEEMDSFLMNKEININIKRKELLGIEIIPGLLYFNDNKILIKLKNKIENNKGQFSLTIKFEFPKTKTFNFNIILNEDLISFDIKKELDFDIFNKLFLVNKLDSELIINKENKNKNINKI